MTKKWPQWQNWLGGPRSNIANSRSKSFSTRTWVTFGGATNTPRSDTNEKKAIIDFCHQRSATITLKQRNIQNRVFLLEANKNKSKFCPKIQFWQNPNIFTSFSPKFFWQFFSWNQSCHQLKSPKPQHSHEFFAQKNRQFSREFKVEFLDKKWRFLTVCIGKLS